MEKVGIRDLKTHLSRHLKKVRQGQQLLITERGRTIATISPVDIASGLDWAYRMVAQGRARWNGGKPGIPANPVKLKGRRTAASIVIRDRR